MSSNIQIEYNRAKINLIKKYLKPSKNLSRASLNSDTFISINDFLAEDHSLGSNAEPGDINFVFNNMNNIYFFIKYLMKDLKFNKIVCNMENIYMNFNQQYYKNTIIYNLDQNQMYLPYNIKDEIIKCSLTNRYNYIYLNIEWLNMGFSHANIIVIDNINKTIERFEPHGKKNGYDKNGLWQKNLDNKFTNTKILKYLNLEDYEYISPEIFEPTIGIQAKIDIYEGMCFTYCIIYLQLRIMNPDLNRKLIIKYLMTKSKKEMIDIILKYAKYIENTLKANSEDINKSLVLYSTESTKKKYNYMIINYKNDFFFFDHFN